MLHHSAPASTCSVEQTHLSFGQRKSGILYGLVIHPVIVLMWFGSKTVRGNEKRCSFPPLPSLDMIHMGLYTASKEGKDYKNLSWCIDIRGSETLSASSSSRVFLMVDVNVRVETVEEGLVAVHYTSKWKITDRDSLWGTRAAVLYFTDDRLLNRLVVKTLTREHSKKPL